MQKKTSIFIKKIILNAGMGWRYPNPSGKGMWFTFLSPFSMGRVTDKYIRIRYGDRKYKTRPHPAPLPCLHASSKSLTIPHIYASKASQLPILWANPFLHKTKNIHSLLKRTMKYPPSNIHQFLQFHKDRQVTINIVEQDTLVVAFPLSLHILNDPLENKASNIFWIY